MAERNEIVAIYVAGVIAGVALVTLPAASTVLTSAAPTLPIRQPGAAARRPPVT